IDRIGFMPGFADALIQVGWLRSEGSILIFPNFDRHNGKSSKKRTLANRRVTQHREKNNKCNARSVTPAFQKALPEEEVEEELKDKNTLSDFGSNRTNEDNPASPEKPPAPENPEPEQTVVRGSGNSPDPDQEVERTGDSDPPDKPDDREKPCEPDPVDLAFGDIFWKAGLCKVGKVKACSAFRTKYRAWKKSTHGSPPEFASMLASDIRRRLSAGVFGMDKLHPATYLNQERWNDELPTDLASPAGGTTSVRDVSHLTDEQRQELVMYELLEGR
ncbi:hypothetical protein M8W81_004519, partial [Salmonella enterica]|nr:hypothetical protein [Salmonella enterica]